MASSSERRYSKEEVQTIFERAAELQRDRGTSDASDLTLDDLQSIGEESGLDPSLIARAASTLDRAPASPESLSLPERFYGVSGSVRDERVLPGSFDDATWADVVHTLRAVFDTDGEVARIGPIREWHAFRSAAQPFEAWAFSESPHAFAKQFDWVGNETKGPVTVEVKPESGDTRVTATYRMPSARLWEGPATVGTLLCAAVILSILFVVNDFPVGLLIGLTAVLTSGVGLGTYYRFARRSELQTARERIEQAMNRIEYLQTSVATSGTAEAAAHDPTADPTAEDGTSNDGAEARLDVEASLDDAADGEGSARRRRTRS